MTDDAKQAKEGCGCSVTGLPSVEQALDRVLARVTPLAGQERVPLHHAAGRVLASGVRGLAPVPRFDNAAMDGYALRAADAPCAGTVLQLRGQTAAGDAPGPPLRPGEARRILTGAPVPPGADAVIKQEDTTRTDAGVRLQRPVDPGLNLRRAGGELGLGADLAVAGTRLTSRHLGLFASAGLGMVPVRPPLRVVMICSGSEVFPAGADLPPGGIWNANAPLLAGAMPEGLILRQVPDTLTALTQALRDAAQLADLIVTTGGVSVGDHDHMRAAVLAAGGDVVLQGVAMKPGKPCCAGTVGSALWLGLPGNPVAAYLAWHLFGAPAMAQFEGRALPVWQRMPLAEPLHHRPGRREFRPARITPEGLRTAGPVSSAALSPLAVADGMMDIPADADLLPAGSRLGFLPFET